ncbi:hypothetical protein BX589_112122 [Paraburkholderia fungorum]|nr:hypothetical protein BX589_112122 [Paraburkholderia fungorum]
MLWGIWSIAGGMLMRGNKGIFFAGRGGGAVAVAVLVLGFWPFLELLVVY